MLDAIGAGLRKRGFFVLFDDRLRVIVGGSLKDPGALHRLRTFAHEHGMRVDVDGRNECCLFLPLDPAQSPPLQFADPSDGDDSASASFAR